MDNKLSEVMNSTMGSIKDLVAVNNIVGEPINTPDGLTLVPVSKLSFAFGGGGGDYPANTNRAAFGAGSAAGVKIEPIGFLVIKEGSVRMLNVTPPAKTSFDRAIDMVPEVLDRVEQIADKKKGLKTEI